MRIYTYSLGELQANCYLLENEGEALIIDPADDASFLLEEVQRKNLKLVGLFGTHGHFDHTMAVGEIQMSFNVPFYIHKKDQFLIDRLESTAEHFLGHKPIIVPPKLVEYVQEGEFKLANFQFKIIAAPGHTPGGVCFYFPEDASIFTGDTLFAGAIGRTDLSYSSKKDLWSSLKTLLALPEEVTIYPGHGESSYIGQEKAILG
jgi:glyoxylase-like metal-dependent hydrolase (beta-lactamase superfamily II)